MPSDRRAKESMLLGALQTVEDDKSLVDSSEFEATGASCASGTEDEAVIFYRIGKGKKGG